MKPSINTDQSPVLLVVCIIAALLIGAIIYFRNPVQNEVKPLIRKLLFSLRVLGVLLVTILLLEPYIRSFFKELEKPLLIVGVDNSESVKMGNKEETISAIQSFVKDLETNKQDQFDLQLISFGENVRSLEGIDYQDRYSDLSGFFDYLDQRFSGRHTAGAVLVSDGIFNRGSNPIYKLPEDMPVYTVGTGDTNQYKDIRVATIYHNDLSYLGNTFPLEVELQARNVDEQVEVVLYRNKKKIDSRRLKITSAKQSYQARFECKADEVGVQEFRVAVTKVANEKNTQNNSRRSYIDILDGRQKIMILQAAPHPDVKYLNEILRQNENYEITLQGIEKPIKNLNSFNLVIVHGAVSSQPFLKLIDQLKSAKVNTMWFTGERSASLVSRLSNKFQLKQRGRKTNDVLPAVQEDFALFELTDSVRNFFQHTPPVKSPFGQYTLSEDTRTILYQKIGSVGTDYPLLSFLVEEGHKMSVFFGEGIWRWRLNAFKQYGNHHFLDEFWSKSVQFLAIKEDKSNFRIKLPNSLFENENLIAEAQLYNKSFELINTPDVNLTLYSSDSKEYPYVMNKTDNHYRHNIGALPPGKYSYTAVAKHDGQEYKKRGVVRIKEIQLEKANMRARHDVLQEIATRTGGKYFDVSSLSEVSSNLASLDSTPLSHYFKSRKDAIQFDWIFYIIFGIICIEWILRKWNGMV